MIQINLRLITCNQLSSVHWGHQFQSALYVEKLDISFRDILLNEYAEILNSDMHNFRGLSHTYVHKVYTMYTYHVIFQVVIFCYSKWICWYLKHVQLYMFPVLNRMAILYWYIGWWCPASPPSTWPSLSNLTPPTTCEIYYLKTRAGFLSLTHVNIEYW